MICANESWQRRYLCRSVETSWDELCYQLIDEFQCHRSTIIAQLTHSQPRLFVHYVNNSEYQMIPYALKIFDHGDIKMRARY